MYRHLHQDVPLAGLTVAYLTVALFQGFAEESRAPHSTTHDHCIFCW
jgi:hypothetical protein